MLPAQYRLKLRRDFSRVYGRGQAHVCREFVLYQLKRKGRGVRIGFSSSKKLGGAVQRNRARRVFRHAAAAIITAFPVGYDYIFVIRSGAENKSAPQIQIAMARQIEALKDGEQ